ncbi:cupin domain-containing protein [Rhodanobacter umsongensis]|uniref:Cupin domain-containing protein n=1 Tax=Rhodanobacter umsongensis TaxID=633153 RepID=A0ABW0JP99_9GAMM
MAIRHGGTMKATFLLEQAMPKIDIANVPERQGSDYPAPYGQPVSARIRQALGRAGGLTDVGVNLMHLPAGSWSSQRHWHTREEEFVYVLSGELTLLTDAGEQPLRAGDCAAFPKNVPDGHHMINRGEVTAVYLDIGTRCADDTCNYSDIDLHLGPEAADYSHKDGKAYR